LSPIRTNQFLAEPIDEGGEYEISTPPLPKVAPVPPTTNIQSQFVVINNYNNYAYPQPAPLPPNARSYTYNIYQPPPPPPYAPYYYSYPPAYTAPPPAYYPFKHEMKENVKEEATEVDIEKLLNKIDVAVRDQTSCRLLQKKLEEGNKEFVGRIFVQLIPNVDSYMNDPFGNYLCQKLFEQCTEEQLSLIIDKVAGKVIDIATDLHGTRAIQKVIEKSVNSPVLLLNVIAMLKGHIAELVMVRSIL